MLKKLHIQNYAIIDEIDIDFSGKLNIITGETGAGKSILVGALSLILGERADTSVLLSQEKKCFIEGTFFVADKKNVIEFLKKNEWEQDDELVLRREIASNGKSRAFINDSPATLQQLKLLAVMLVDLHQQFDTLELSESSFQLEVIDALAANDERLKKYTDVFLKWQLSSAILEKLYQQKNDFNKEADYHRFLKDELTEAAFKENELEELDNELKILSNAEGIKTILSKVTYELSDSEQPIVQTLKQLYNQLGAYASYHEDISLLIHRLQSTQIELQDIAEETERLNNSVNYDEKKIELINDRLSLGYKLLKKHGVKTTAELLEVQSQLTEKLQQVLNIDTAIQTKEKEVKELYLQLQKIAGDISDRRKKQIQPLEENVNSLLVQVGMPNAKLKVGIKETVINISGKDMVEFLFDANKSNRFEPLRKVASGGELSRLMLCIKSLVAESVDLPTMIFDEIDTGISGEAAKQVGIIMKALAAKRQVIAITHQPQIAGRGDAHFFVYKEIREHAIKTNIRLLSQEERITTIAQMLSGERPTAAALQNAREMVMN